MRIVAAKRFMLLIEAVLLTILMAVVLAPLTLPEGSVTDLDGHIGRVDDWERIVELPGPQRAVYLLGDVNCHQQAARSYELNGNQMPFCARDIGLLAGATMGLTAFILLGRRPSWPWLLPFLVPLAMDGVLQAMTSYESTNAVRTATGAIAGLAVGYAIGALVQGYFTVPGHARGERDDGHR